jgi:hypothetical protein
MENGLKTIAVNQNYDRHIRDLAAIDPMELSKAKIRFR